jgi:hypothetical protein
MNSEMLLYKNGMTVALDSIVGAICKDSKFLLIHIYVIT